MVRSAVDHAVDALVVELQPVEEGLAEAAAFRGFHVRARWPRGSRRGGDRWRRRRRSARAFLASVRREGQHRRRGARLAAELAPSRRRCRSASTALMRLGLQRPSARPCCRDGRARRGCRAPEQSRRRASLFLPLTRSASSRPRPASPRAISRPSGSRIATRRRATKSPVTLVTPIGSRLLPVEQRLRGAGIDMERARRLRASP